MLYQYIQMHLSIFLLLVNKSYILIIGPNISAEKSLNDIVKWGLFKVFSKLILCSLSHNTYKMYHLSPVW